jgi:hypothetical protein
MPWRGRVATTYIIGHFLLWRTELFVVAAARGNMHKTANNTTNNILIVDLEFESLQGLVLLRKHGIKLQGVERDTRAREIVELDKTRQSHRISYLLSLWQRSREAIENEAIFARRRVDGLLDQVDHQLVGYQLATSHDGGSGLAELGVGSNGRTKHVAGGQVADRLALALFFNLFGLRALTGAGWADEDDAKRPTNRSCHDAMREVEVGGRGKRQEVAV